MERDQSTEPLAHESDSLLTDIHALGFRFPHLFNRAYEKIIQENT